MSSWSVGFMGMFNSSILNSYIQNLDLCVVPLHHLEAISKNSWAKWLGLASVLTRLLYSHIKNWQRAPFLVLTLFKEDVWCEISQHSQNQTTTLISRYRVFSNGIMKKCSFWSLRTGWMHTVHFLKIRIAVLSMSEIFQTSTSPKFLNSQKNVVFFFALCFSGHVSFIYVTGASRCV